MMLDAVLQKVGQCDNKSGAAVSKPGYKNTVNSIKTNPFYYGTLF